MNVEQKMAAAVVAELLAQGRDFKISFDTPTGQCWLDFEANSGVNTISDYDGPDEVMIPLLEVAQNAVE